MDETIYKFELTMSLMTSGIIDRDRVGESAVFDDRAVVQYKLKRAMAFQDLIDMLDDNDNVIMLYKFILRRDSQVGRSCSYYSNNRRGPMFRIDFYTERDGMCHSVTVIFFTSLEYMYQDIMREHGRIQLHGKLEYLRPERKVIADFM
jgi:hypothetical protein